MTRWVRAAALGLAAALTACSLVVPVDKLSSGDRTDSGEAGPTDAPDASVDAPSDTADALAPADAECDATFCDDFESLPFGANWTGTQVAAGGSIGPTEGGRSGIGALSAYAESGAPVNRKAILLRRFAKPRRVDCSFAIRPGVIIEAESAFRLSVTASGYTVYALYLQLRSSETGFVRAYNAVDGASPFDIYSLPYLPTGAWADVRIKTDFVTLQVYVGGALVKELPAHAIDVSSVDIELGLRSNGARAAAATYDDVRCTVEP